MLRMLMNNRRKGVFQLIVNWHHWIKDIIWSKEYKLNQLLSHASHNNLHLKEITIKHHEILFNIYYIVSFLQLQIFSLIF